MTALIRYMVQDLLRSGKYFVPTVVYLIFIPWLYTVKPNPVLESYGVTAAVLFGVSAWLFLQLRESEPARQAQLTILHAGSLKRYVLGRLAVLGLAALAFTLYAVAVPLVMPAFDRPVNGTDLLLALYAHVTAYALGSLLAWVTASALQKRSAVMGAVLTGVACSLAAGGLERVLPDAVSWLIWALPPVYRIMEAMAAYEAPGSGSGWMGLRIVYPVVYAAAGLALAAKLFRVPKV